MSMAPPISDPVGGISTTELDSWKQFQELVIADLSETSNFIWRGHKKASWKLESSFDRALGNLDAQKKRQLSIGHLARFKLAARGRRGLAPSQIENDNDWWALAQHNGMVTPLLDWTESPFVALYFAFEKSIADRGERAVFALGNVSRKLRELKEAGIESTSVVLEMIRPQQDDNARLVCQAGLFTRLPLGLTVEQWTETTFADDPETVHLFKFIIPDEGREQCLIALNQMNINHLSLFPDLYGAGEHCNKALKIKNYSSSILR